jgi:hypothetical protein
MMGHYILQNKQPRKVHFLEWARWFDKPNKRRVAQDKIKDIRISTVFLGLDHNYYDTGPPILFETMIFGGKHDDYQTRCSTWEQAEKMHKEAVHLVRRSLLKLIPPDPPEV